MPKIVDERVRMRNLRSMMIVMMHRESNFDEETQKNLDFQEN